MLGFCLKRYVIASKCFKTLPNRSKTLPNRSKTLQNAPKRSKTIQNAPERSKTLQNVPKRYINVPKRFKTLQNAPRRAETSRNASKRIKTYRKALRRAETRRNAPKRTKTRRNAPKREGVPDPPPRTPPPFPGNPQRGESLPEPKNAFCQSKVCIEIDALRPTAGFQFLSLGLRRACLRIGLYTVKLRMAH